MAASRPALGLPSDDPAEMQTRELANACARGSIDVRGEDFGTWNMGIPILVILRVASPVYFDEYQRICASAM